MYVKHQVPRKSWRSAMLLLSVVSATTIISQSAQADEFVMDFPRLSARGTIFKIGSCTEATRTIALPPGYEIDYSEPHNQGYTITVISMNDPSGSSVSHTLNKTNNTLTSYVKVCPKYKQEAWYEGRHVLYGKKSIVALNVSKNGSGTIVGGGINCGTTVCNKTYKNGTQVSLTATPAAGFSFYNWSGCSSSTSPTITVGMNTDKTCMANFVQPASISGNIWNDLNGDGKKLGELGSKSASIFLEYQDKTLEDGSHPTLLELTDKDGNFKFSDLDYPGKYILFMGLDEAGKTLSLPGDPFYYEIDLQKFQQVIGKDFGIAPTFTLAVTKATKGKVNSTDGFINCGTDCTESSYPVNAQVTLTATPNKGFKFVKWTGDDECNQSKSNPITVKMTKAKKCTPNF